MADGRAGGSVLTSGPERLLDAAGISIDRMPMLHVILDNMAAQGSESLRQLSPAPALFSVESLGTARVGDVLDGAEGHTIVGIYHVQPWDSRILIGLEHDLVFALVEALFGGDGGESYLVEKRALSGIEIRLARKVFEIFATALQGSFAPIVDARFKLERVETRLDFVNIAPRNSFAAIIRMKLRILGRDNSLFVLFPQAVLNFVRQDLGRDPSSDMSVRDPRWLRQIGGEIGRTEVVVTGVIEERHFTLADIATLKVGDVLPLQATARTRVKLECNAEPLFWCHLGQADGLYTLRVDTAVNHATELPDDILLA
jgi:flagellar motor switch protein FliM